MYSNHKAPRPVSRRVVLGTAGVGVLGAAGAAIGIKYATDSDSPSTADAAEETAQNAGVAANANVENLGGPLVVHVENPDTGEMNIFYGTQHIRATNRDLVNQLRQATNSK